MSYRPYFGSYQRFFIGLHISMMDEVVIFVCGDIGNPRRKRSDRMYGIYHRVGQNVACRQYVVSCLLERSDTLSRHRRYQHRHRINIKRSRSIRCQRSDDRLLESRKIIRSDFCVIRIINFVDHSTQYFLDEQDRFGACGVVYLKKPFRSPHIYLQHHSIYGRSEIFGTYE